MPLVDPETFDNQEVALIYIAGRLRESKRVEHALSAHAIAYAVDSEPYRRYLLGILPVQSEGVGFYVLSGRAEFCRRILRQAGLVQGLVAEDYD